MEYCGYIDLLDTSQVHSQICILVLPHWELRWPFLRRNLVKSGACAGFPRGQAASATSCREHQLRVAHTLPVPIGARHDEVTKLG